MWTIQQAVKKSRGTGRAGPGPVPVYGHWASGPLTGLSPLLARPGQPVASARSSSGCRRQAGAPLRRPGVSGRRLGPPGCGSIGYTCFSAQTFAVIWECVWSLVSLRLGCGWKFSFMLLFFFFFLIKSKCCNELWLVIDEENCRSHLK